VSRRARIPEYWEAEVELEISNVAFTIPYDERRVGSRAIRTFKPRCIKDGKVLFDVGKKLRGWIKEQVRTVKPSAFEAVQYGFKAFSLPEAGEVPIADAKELIGDDDFPEKFRSEYEVPNGLPYPFMETIMIKDSKSIKSTFSFYYVLPKAVRVKAKLFCFARNITPEVVKDLMDKLGGYTGLGDRHAHGYGNFRVISFKHQKGTLQL
jgi:hypothetical protein